MTDWTSLDYVAVDVEGNGQQPPGLVELAAVPIVAGVIGEPRSWLIRPSKPITPRARRVHGISNEAVADAPALAVIEGDVLLALSHQALVAHNAHVDVDVLQRELPGWKCPEVFDTLKLSRRFMRNQPSHKLGTLVETLKLAEDLPQHLKPHRATYDALVAARLFVYIASRPDVPWSLEELRGPVEEGGGDEAATLF